ncbi:MAG: flagellar motor switch protein FliN [Actinomycetota bacterium]|nr:flagellar motor switch protein FliN [Actinomycetota bacterium]
MSPPGIEDDLFDDPAPPAEAAPAKAAPTKAAAASVEDDLFADPAGEEKAVASPEDDLFGDPAPAQPAAPEPAPGAEPEDVTAARKRRRTDEDDMPEVLTPQVVATPGTPVRPVASAAVVTHPVGTAMSQLGLESLRVLQSVEMELSVELGRARIPVREILELAPGSIMELDRPAGAPVDVLVNGTLLARGEVVVVDDEFGVRITELLGGPDENHGQG